MRRCGRPMRVNDTKRSRSCAMFAGARPTRARRRQSFGAVRLERGAVRALQQLNPTPVKCIAAEAEPQHFRWMLEYFTDNGVDPNDHDFVWAAVGPQRQASCRSGRVRPAVGTARQCPTASCQHSMPVRADS